MTYINVNTIFIKKYIKRKVTIKPVLHEETVKTVRKPGLSQQASTQVKEHHFGTGGLILSMKTGFNVV